MIRAVSVYVDIEAALGPGRIMASYQRVCLLQTAAGALLTLALPEIGNGPNAMLLDLPGGFADWPIGAGFERVDRRRCRFEHGPIIDWSQAPRWSSQDSAPPGPPHYDHTAALSSALRSHELREGLLPILLQQEQTTPLQRALAARAAPLLAALPDATAAEQLVGLGPGSTPSGDDLLAGLLLTLHYAQHTAAEPLRRVAQQARTTALSRAALLWAARGEASEHTLNLLRSLFCHPAEKLPAALEPVLEHGATSGADYCAGILCGLRTLGSRP